MALNISSYGAEELKQLMELMQMENNSNLYLCRPLKVVSYLRVGISNIIILLTFIYYFMLAVCFRVKL